MKPRLREPSEVLDRFLSSAEIGKWSAEVSSSYIDPYRLWEVAVPSTDSLRVGLSEESYRLSTINPVEPDVPMCFDVLTFFPIPTPNWQESALAALQVYADGWRSELRRVEERLRDAVMFAVPFWHMLTGTPEKWVTTRKIDGVTISDYLEGWEGDGEGVIFYVRRPYIVWPRSPGSQSYAMRIARRNGSQELLEIHRQPLSHPKLRL